MLILLAWRCCLSGESFLGTAASLSVDIAANLLLLLFLLAFLAVASHPRATIIQRSILCRQIVAALISGPNVVAAALGQSAGAGGELGGDGGVGRNPISEGILTVLNDGPTSFISVVCLPGLAGSDRGVVNELKEVLAVAGNDGNFFAMLTESIKLVRIGSLDLLASNVGELSLGDERLGLGTDKLLLQDDNLG